MKIVQQRLANHKYIYSLVHLKVILRTKLIQLKWSKPDSRNLWQRVTIKTKGGKSLKFDIGVWKGLVLS